SRVNTGEQDRLTLMEKDRAWSQTTQNLDQWVSYFAPNASFYAQGIPTTRGAGNIRQAILQMSSTPGFSLKRSPARVAVSEGADLGYTSGSYELTVGGPAGQPRFEKGQYVTVWRKQRDGQWKVTEDILSAEGAKPPASSPSAT